MEVVRLDPKLVHPSVSKTASAVVWNGGIDVGGGTISAYETQWLKEQGAGSLTFVLVATAAFTVSILGVKAMGIQGPAAKFLVLVLALAFAATLIVGATRGARNVTVGQYEALLPTLDLTAIGRAYVETMIALQRAGRPQAEADDTMRALNALLDEEARLLAMREATGREPGDSFASLESERAALAAKATAAADAGAREAYGQSLSLLDERIDGLRAVDAGRERLDAHLELLRQAVLATRDAARRLGTAPAAIGSDLATDSLRAAVALARAQTTETERALAELRAI